jgi:hypothetical protein
MVWITSGHYSFKFDKKETLGMIAPIWEKFPLPILPGYTSIFLQLSRDYRPKELISEIKSFDPRLLIFLRKLRQVNLKSSDERGKVWKTTLRRHDVSSGPNGDNVIELWHNAASSSLKSTHFQVNGFSPEPKRPGCSHSEILLAFPITRGGEPWIQSQNVYAFLPIRDYGFKVRSILHIPHSKLLTKRNPGHITSSSLLIANHQKTMLIILVPTPSGFSTHCKS